jgi:hypothetical protein
VLLGEAALVPPRLLTLNALQQLILVGGMICSRLRQPPDWMIDQTWALPKLARSLFDHHLMKAHMTLSYHLKTHSMIFFQELLK